MRKLLTLCVMILSLPPSLLLAQPSVPDSVAARRLAAYVRRYPEAQLKDVYKFCFQGAYGPGHLVTDSVACASYIVQEMARMGSSDTLYPSFEYAGVEENYVRVSLRVISDGRVPLEMYVALLMESAINPSPMPVAEWRGRWEGYLRLMRQQAALPRNFEEDSAAIARLLERGEYVSHHSARFNAAYAPHYRLIRRDLFEQCLIPLLRITIIDSQ